MEDDHNALVSSEYSECSQEYDFHYEGNVFCNPASRPHRYFVLIFMCLLAFGSYYCYDNPGALHDHFTQDMNLTESEYAGLYAAYSYPNVILCFFGGYLIDAVFGIRLGAIIFASIICLGQLIFAAGAYFNNFPLTIFGRFIFGVGGESLAVAQNTYSVLWFKGKELNTVFGVQLSVARLGSMANFNSMEHIYNAITEKFEGHTGLAITLLIAGAFCLFSVVCSLILAFFDKRAEKLLNREANGTGETVNIRDVLQFPFDFWMLCVVCVTYYVAIFPFISFGTAFLHEKYNYTEAEAGTITGIPYIVSAIVSPFCGILCDFTGLNLIWTFIATVFSCVCHVGFAFLPPDVIPPGVIMGILGFQFSLLACSFWPMVALIIPEHQLGTAYGVMQAIQNLGLAVVAQLAGFIKEKYGNDMMELFFMSWMVLAIASTLGLLIYNKAHGGCLNPPLYKTRLPCCRKYHDGEEPLGIEEE